MKVEPLYRVVVGLFCVACFALFAGITLSGIVAQDATPLVAAGRLALAGEWSLYPTVDPSPVMSAPFLEASCAVLRGGQLPCEEVAVPFVSPPWMVPPAMVLGALPGTVGIACMRLLTTACLAWGTWRVWHEVALANPSVGRPLAVGMLLLLPMVQSAIEYGQSSPWLLALAAAGFVARGDSWGDALRTGGLLAACTATKASPLWLVTVLVWAGRWRAVGVCLALVAALALATLALPRSVYVDYVAFFGPFSHWVLGFPQNTSLDALLAWVLPLGAVRAITVAKAVAVLGTVAALARGGAAPGRVWLAACVGWLVMSPINWWHYNLLAVPALMGTVAVDLRGEAGGWALAAWMALPSLFLQVMLAGHPAAVIVGPVFALGSFAAVVFAVARPRLQAIPANR